MKKVITYGTFDLLHHGHVRLLERARALGDWLVVGVTSDSYDAARGKIDVRQSVAERIEAVRSTGLADEILVEEYEGQKIDDIVRLEIDVFAIGSDWLGKFDYLESYCEVVYLDRTRGVSSTQLRASGKCLRLGLVGDAPYMRKFARECELIDGIRVVAACTNDGSVPWRKGFDIAGYPLSLYAKMLREVDAVYIATEPDARAEHVMMALRAGKHVLCESPIALDESQYRCVLDEANSNGLVLAEGIKTAHSTAYHRLKLLMESGRIGEIVSIDATCTSLRHADESRSSGQLQWGSLFEWGPTALLPVFELLGTEYDSLDIVTRASREGRTDGYTWLALKYSDAVATVKVGSDAKSEGELVISGTQGYALVPAPWWKTEYFELRYEDADVNRRYFFQLEGEGIRRELLSFAHTITAGKSLQIPRDVTLGIVRVMGEFYGGKCAKALRSCR